MKYGLLTYDENRKSFNVGDYIQSLAARQFLPQVDEYVNRESLGEYSGGPTKLIMNGWFTHNASGWVPSRDIEPKFVSFHVNNTAAPLMLSPQGIAYLKQHQPIGCRDQFTVDLLQGVGVEAYFSGCLTLTLDNYRVSDAARTDDIYIVDPLYGYTTWNKVTYSPRRFVRSVVDGKILTIGRRRRHLEKLLDPQLRERAQWIEQEPPAQTYTDGEKFEMAEGLLNRYAKAKLVITSRIHCALPCLALGTPVVFVNGFESEVDSCRFGGIHELFNRIDMNVKTGHYTSTFGLEGKVTEDTVMENPPDFRMLVGPMKQTCSSFLSDS
ncbi:polysaccharide pyruvyl transferase family protein [Rubrivirga sp. IMCC43871]|uniref:polysaccharide pyruvyl transferase family protein n=1 Tax=Rubrivirga sp. IMCC43871 TaxID=3391575 RepID=UPI00398F9F40